MQIFLNLREYVRSRGTVLCCLLFVGLVWSSWSSAATSKYCPTLKATVANGKSVAVNVSACDGPFDGGMSGPIRPFAQNGKVNIGANSGKIQRVTYTHKGNSATSDVFYLEDNDNGVVTVNIMILKPKTRKP